MGKAGGRAAGRIFVGDEEEPAAIPESYSAMRANTQGRSMTACRPSSDALGYTPAPHPLATEGAQGPTLILVNPALIFKPQWPQGSNSLQSPPTTSVRYSQFPTGRVTDRSLPTLITQSRSLVGEVGGALVYSSSRPRFWTPAKSWDIRASDRLYSYGGIRRRLFSPPRPSLCSPNTSK